MSNNMVLSRIFTQHVFKDLINKRTNNVYLSVIRRVINNPFEKNNGEIISEIYSYLSKHYRNEYFYQNTLLNKLLLGRHSINTTVALTQIPISKSKADFVLINGKAVVYEIKSELDNLERLNTQITDYYRAFDHVCVVTCEDNYEKLKKMLADTPVGICILTKRDKLSLKKKPQQYFENIDHRVLFKVLHKNEYEKVLYKYYNALPETSQVFYYDECLRWFKQIPIREVYDLALKELKHRNKIIKSEFVKVPYELKSLMYFYNEFDNNYSELNSFLEDQYEEVE